MKPTSEILGNIEQHLPTKLGPEYEIHRAGTLLPERWPSEMPWLRYMTDTNDLVIHNGLTGKYIIVEVTGATADDELPFGVFPAVKRLKDAAASVDPTVVLVSTSRVAPQLKDHLSQGGIHLLESSRADIVSQLADLITADVSVPIS